MFLEKILKTKEKNKFGLNNLYAHNYIVIPIKYKSRSGAIDFYGERVTTLLCVRVQMYVQIINIQAIPKIYFTLFFFRTQLLL